jgi:hypothetical protein
MQAQRQHQASAYNQQQQQWKIELEQTQRENQAAYNQQRQWKKAAQREIKPQPLTNSSRGSGIELEVNKVKGKTGFITSSSSGGSDYIVWRWSSYQSELAICKHCRLFQLEIFLCCYVGYLVQFRHRVDMPYVYNNV